MLRKTGALTKISLVCNLIFLVAILWMSYNQSQRERATESDLATATYIAIHTQDNWETTSPESYYLFVDKDLKAIQITDFKQNLLFEASYEELGNGVFQLADEKGFMRKEKNKLKLTLAEAPAHVIYTDYTFFSK